MKRPIERMQRIEMLIALEEVASVCSKASSLRLGYELKKRLRLLAEAARDEARLRAQDVGAIDRYEYEEAQAKWIQNSSITIK